MEPAFLYLRSKKIPKPVAARIIVLTNIQKYFGISIKNSITWMVKFTVENGNIVCSKFTHILTAVTNNQLEIVKYLHQNGADITAKDNLLLSFACEYGYLEIVKYLHENGADLNDGNGIAISEAIRHGHLNVVKYLHKNGAFLDDKTMFILKACSGGFLDVVKYLYRNILDLIDTRGSELIYWASMYNKLEIVKYLHSKGANIRTNYDAICWASRNGHLEVVKYLHQNGANIKTRNNCPIRWAIEYGHLEVVKYLEQYC